jgi:hypothetical protein
MITMETERLVDDYLRRLEAACAHLERSRRTELVAEIREHIDVALQHEEAGDEVAVRNVLERLGPPEEIVAEAEPPASESLTRPGKLEIAALVALVVPFLGWLVGIALVLVSQAWSKRDKIIGVALVLVPALLPLIGVLAESSPSTQEPAPGPPGSIVDDPGGPAHSETSTDGGLGAVEIVALTFLFLGGLPSALYLGFRLRRV